MNSALLIQLFFDCFSQVEEANFDILWESPDPSIVLSIEAESIAVAVEVCTLFETSRDTVNTAVSGSTHKLTPSRAVSNRSARNLILRIGK